MRNFWFVCVALLVLGACGDDNSRCEEVGTCGDQTGACDANPCGNGGTCTPIGASFSCTCLPGYGGATCADNIDECATHACQNGATCVDGLNGYSCTCASGYTGAFCETDIDECAAATSPCSPNATCANTAGSHTCQCTSDYVGDGVTCATTLIGEWRLDGDATDSSTGDHDGTAENTSDTTGWARAAYAFTTAGASAVRIPYIDLRATSFTVQAWVRPTIGTNVPVFTQCESATADHCLRLGLTSNRATMTFGGSPVVGEETLANDRWHHVAWVYDADAQTQRIFIDGVLDVEEAGHAPYLGASGETALGRHLVDAVSAEATIDEVKLFDKVRSTLLIAADAQQVVRYDFAGGIATDAGSYRLNGSLSAGVTSVSGFTGEALSLDPAANGGVGAHVTTPALAALADGGPFTIEIRARADAATGATLVSIADSAESTGWCMPALGLTTRGVPAAQIYNGSSVLSVVGVDPIVPGTWTRITQSFDADHGVRLFVDGELVEVDPNLSQSDPDVGAVAFALAGAAPGTCQNDIITQGPFDGTIDDLRIDHTARSADDIAASEGFDHACSYILAEHPAYTTTARDLALCGNTYIEETIEDACNIGWHVCTVSEWRARVLPPGFDPEADEAPPIAGPLTSWGAPQDRRCPGYFWEANRPIDGEVWDSDVCADAYNPWNNGKYLYADDGSTVLEGNGDCCDWDSDFAPFVPDPVYDDSFAVYCCKG